MDLSFAALEPEITAQLATAQIIKSAVVKKVAHALLSNGSRFLTVEAATGVPALWTMPVFYREKPSFDSYFGNGDPLNEATIHVPKGRGPFIGPTAWEEGVIDALNLDHITHVETWGWPQFCYMWEKWNGFGARLHGRPSGYVWAYTDQYKGGKYIHDGPGGWSPGTWDQQIGCLALARTLAAEDQGLIARLS